MTQKGKAFCWMAVALAAAAGVQQAKAGTVINACVNKWTGITRIVNSASDCLPEEKFDSWNVQGPAGPIGPQGLTGVAGPKGVAGPQGATGASGAPGAAGPAGPAGMTGATGTAGAAGAQGPAGPVGLTGPAGLTGAVGAQGTAGPAGPIGLTGATGVAGAQGPAGPAGPLGLTGAPGAAGPTGLTGAAGSAGAAGAQGPAGPAGPSGPTGTQGPAGPAGAPGTIPANLQAISNQLGTSGYASELFDYQGTCTLGDMILSVNSYGGTSNALPADGRLMPITNNTAIFSVLGTTFGGDGVTTFALPDLRAFAPQGMQYSICVLGIFPSRN